MIFIIDNQTISDLELKDRNHEEKSVFSLFNHTKTNGGKNKLALFYNHPLTDIEQLENRIRILEFFVASKITYRFDKELFDFIELYFRLQDVPGRFSVSRSAYRAVRNIFKPRNDYYIIQRGTRYLVEIFNDFYSSIREISIENSPTYILNCRDRVIEIFEKTPLRTVIFFKDRKLLNPLQLGKLDFCFRKSCLDLVQEVLEIIYEFDAFLSIVDSQKKLGFSYPEFTKESNQYQATGLYHPFLPAPVTNDFEYTAQTNMCFLTGPNMAGKSTFLKALSISIYLSHIGFPVPAKKLTTSVFNGLLTTINLPDNINKGYSHFYNEVLRVKFVAEKIQQAGILFVVFDEIFRGTNVKDAYEASLAVLNAFSKSRNSLFAVSTHIIEVGEELRKHPSIFFKYFGANVVDGIPHYSYALNDGITAERIGMYILEKEKVIETIENGNLTGQVIYPDQERRK